MTSVDVHQFLHGRTKLHKLTSISFSMDVQNYISGRLSVSLWTYNITSVDVHLFLYELTTCGYGRPPVTIWTCNITQMDVNQNLYGRTT